MKLKSLFYSLLMASLASTAYAQVKIGANPGTIGATSNLEVEATNGNKTSVNKSTGQVTIVDGTQAAKRVLTSDANGGASWQDLPSGKLILGSMPDSQTTVLDVPTNGSFIYLGASITLPAGKWLIFASSALYGRGAAGTNINLQTYLSSSPTSLVAPVSLSNPVYPGFISGQILLGNTEVHNSGNPQIITVASTTTYYVICYQFSVTGASTGLATMSRNASGTEYFFAQSLDY